MRIMFGVFQLPDEQPPEKDQPITDEEIAAVDALLVDNGIEE